MSRNTKISSIKSVTRKLKEISRFVCAKQRQGNVQKSVLRVQSFSFLLIRKKSVLHVQSCFFLLIRSIVVVFYRSRCLHLVFSITRFYIFFEETINKESFALSPGLIYILHKTPINFNRMKMTLSPIAVETTNIPTTNHVARITDIIFLSTVVS